MEEEDTSETWQGRERRSRRRTREVTPTDEPQSESRLTRSMTSDCSMTPDRRVFRRTSTDNPDQTPIMIRSAPATVAPTVPAPPADTDSAVPAVSSPVTPTVSTPAAASGDQGASASSATPASGDQDGAAAACRRSERLRDRRIIIIPPRRPDPPTVSTPAASSVSAPASDDQGAASAPASDDQGAASAPAPGDGDAAAAARRRRSERLRNRRVNITPPRRGLSPIDEDDSEHSSEHEEAVSMQHFIKDKTDVASSSSDPKIIIIIEHCVVNPIFREKAVLVQDGLAEKLATLDINFEVLCNPYPAKPESFKVKIDDGSRCGVTLFTLRSQIPPIQQMQDFNVAERVPQMVELIVAHKFS